MSTLSRVCSGFCQSFASPLSVGETGQAKPTLSNLKRASSCLRRLWTSLSQRRSLSVEHCRTPRGVCARILLSASPCVFSRACLVFVRASSPRSQTLIWSVSSSVSITPRVLRHSRTTLDQLLCLLRLEVPIRKLLTDEKSGRSGRLVGILETFMRSGSGVRIPG